MGIVQTQIVEVGTVTCTGQSHTSTGTGHAQPIYPGGSGEEERDPGTPNTPCEIHPVTSGHPGQVTWGQSVPDPAIPSGYANEVGESFRPLVPVPVVWASYGVATAYVTADAIDKGRKAAAVSAAPSSPRSLSHPRPPTDACVPPRPTRRTPHAWGWPWWTRSCGRAWPRWPSPASPSTGCVPPRWRCWAPSPAGPCPCAAGPPLPWGWLPSPSSSPPSTGDTPGAGAGGWHRPIPTALRDGARLSPWRLVPVWVWGWEHRVLMGCLHSKGALLGSSQDMSLSGWGLSRAELGLAQ